MGLHKVPRILIAAPASGSGKTLIICGILELFRQMNIEPVSYKCGPDYIDPMFHRNVLGINGSNLDSFFCSDEKLNEIVNGTHGKIAVIEGVMGIYDGVAVDSDAGSCYSIARAVDAGIILVVDARGQGRTVISLIKGILADDSSKLIKGIIINRMSEYFYKKLAPVLEHELDIIRPDVKLIGFIPKLDGINLESRHLGLKMPEEIEGLRQQIELVAGKIAEFCDVNKILEISRYGRPDGDADNIVSDSKRNMKGHEVDITLAIARDEAFCFYYRENIELLEKSGITIKYFSPINDENIPEADGLLLGGGYPELYLDRLSGNISMINSIRDALANGMPCLAECGGFMYLHDSIRDDKNQTYKMAGVIKGDCFYTGHLVRFGYITLNDSEKQNNSAIAGMRGHEFHYYDSTSNGEAYIAVKPDGSKQWKCMISDGVSYMGYPHLYYPSKPQFIDQFIENMKKYKEKV